MCFEPVAAVFVITRTFFDSIFSEVDWIGKLPYFHEGICIPDNGCHGSRKKAISQLS